MLHVYCSVRGCGSATPEEARPTRRHKADRGLLKIHRGRTYRSTAYEHPVTPSHSSLQPSQSGRHPITPSHSSLQPSQSGRHPVTPSHSSLQPSQSGRHPVTPSHSSLHPLTPSQLRRPRFGENLKQRQQAIKRYSMHSLCVLVRADYSPSRRTLYMSHASAIHSEYPPLPGECTLALTSIVH